MVALCDRPSTWARRAVPPFGAFAVGPVAASAGVHNGSFCRAAPRRQLPQLVSAALIPHRRHQWVGVWPGSIAQVVAWIASRITLVTRPGLEIMDRCGAPGAMVMWACACRAMARSSAGGMAWSAVPITAQEGIVCQAGTPDFWVSAMVESGRWVAARICASLVGKPLARQDGNTLCLMYGVLAFSWTFPLCCFWCPIVKLALVIRWAYLA